MWNSGPTETLQEILARDDSPTSATTTLRERSDAPPAWSSPGSHPSASLLGEVAVWRAANGINPHDPRATGGPQLEPRADLWKQHLDRAVANELSRRLDLDQQPVSQQLRHRYQGDPPRLHQQPSSNRPPVPGR